ncbi:hypothetical protein KM043_003507 [Ampulex compressa]|nr:hypothetical protein KM043_003507 [Ampulex compressa]
MRESISLREFSLSHDHPKVYEEPRIKPQTPTKSHQATVIQRSISKPSAKLQTPQIPLDSRSPKTITQNSLKHSEPKTFQKKPHEAAISQKSISKPNTKPQTPNSPTLTITQNSLKNPEAKIFQKTP